MLREKYSKGSASSIHHLEIMHFRNFQAVSLRFSPRFNIFYGKNGAGKSSLLEAMYYLAFGKSFRTTSATKLIQHHAEKFYICAKMHNGVIAGVSRHHSGDKEIKLNGEKQHTVSEIATQLPMQFMSPLSYRFFHDGSKVRRKYLDWAVFHVKPFFLSEWRSFQRLLKQRNEALKQKQNTALWDAAFIESAEKIDQARSSIFQQLKTWCTDQLIHLLPRYTFTLRYQRGWHGEQSLQSLLMAHHPRDQHLGYTYYGPQRADFQLLCDGTLAQDVLSQGQQKLAAYALQLAIGKLLQHASQKSPIYLIDDLSSELDRVNQEKVLTVLHHLEAQTFITSIKQEPLYARLCGKDAFMFHVKHGSITAQPEQPD